MNNAEVIFKVIIMTAMPVVVTFVLKYLQIHREPFKNCKDSTKNIVVGALFGLCAIYGTEFGVNTGMAIVNTRDSAVICAGIFFGGPAALIAALIGSVERFLAPLWGVGTYTRWACSIATLLAGVVITLLRYHFFEKKRPAWHQALAVGVFYEVFHLLLVFVTHMDDIHNAFSVVKACSGYMLIMNGLSVMLSTIVVTLLEGDSLFTRDGRYLTTQFNFGLIISMFVGFILSIGFTTVLEHSLYRTDTEKTLTVTIADVEDQIEYASQYNLLEKNKIISGATQFKHVYSNGSVIIVDSNDIIFSDRNGNVGKKASDLGYDLTKTEGKMLKTSISGIESFYMYKVKDDYCIIACVSVDEAKLSSELSMYIVFFMEMIVFAMMFINVFYLIKTLVIKNMDDVNEGLSKITDGNLDTVLKINKNREFAYLSDGINNTVKKLKDYIDEANTRIDEELEVAKQIQASSVPTVFPKHSDGEIYALMDTAKEVGGDFYDFFFVPPYNLFILIADVSGKGIPGALFMMRAKTLIKNIARETRSDDIGLIFTQANESLCESNDAEMFVTAWMGCINLRNGHVKFANAGHNKPVMKRVGQKATFLDEKVNFVLAGMDGIQYVTQELDMNPGDTIYLYTDGFTEATNVNNELFGDQRLLDVLTEVSQDPEVICKKVKEATTAFTGEAPQFDDMTELAFMYKKE